MENKIVKKSKIWSKTKQIAIKNQWSNLKDKKIKKVKTKKYIILECKCVFILKKQMLLEAKKPNMWTDLKKKERRGSPKKCTII